MNPFHNLHEPQRLGLLICFVDIENFTSIAQAKADPIELFGILSGMAKVMSEMIRPTEGRIIKFIGDSALIVFPESAADSGMRLLL
jgi:class 3 adenylate cyclase